MVKVIRAQTLGFCMGVRRAVDLAYEAVDLVQADRSGNVYTLGPLIHNPVALAELERRGLKTLDEHNLPQDLRGVTVLIRAHGVSPAVEAELCEKGAVIVDATCPRVKTSQLKAAEFAAAGYRIFLAGEEGHAEITGLKDYCMRQTEGSETNCTAFYAVAGNANEAADLAARLYAEDGEKNSGAKTALIGQTTISAEEYHAIGQAIIRFFPGLEIAETICPATKERQDDLQEMLTSVNAVIIAGGKASANTCRLFAIAQASGKPCAIVETPADIPAEFFSFNTIGLASGASTPDTVIDEIERMFYH